MTSRPSMGVHQRQPQRSLSGTGLPQRPPHQRSLSQQYLPPSPVRREQYPDFASPEQNDAAFARNGTLRRGGSRLKLELSNESITEDGFSESPSGMDSSKVITPSRIMPMPDGSELGDMSPRQTSVQGTDHDPLKMPMPLRRKRFAPATLRQPTSTNTAPAALAKKDARPKPWSFEVPAAAPHYTKPGRNETPKTFSSISSTTANTQSKGHADFFPWTGDHAEDHFSENVIRTGYFDKAPIAQTETSSAKGALFPILKHKPGLHMLSQIFTGVLGQRRHSGQITSDSQFKLPPRVTVTDARREAWLKDLANPEIPLRKLSRTIPHGVRGKTFFDQCLNKSIPIERAVWLAKCCGSQDLRAFKRKGVGGSLMGGGEAKWIRDWTVCIEQFLEARISAVGEGDWKVKVTYA
jgi:mediator of RNA polymerase II transcription subunit 12, fungi type